MARALFGPRVSELAVYQSWDANYCGTACTLLRLCENNFRIGLYGDSTPAAEGFAGALLSQANGRKVWVKSSELVSLFLTEAAEWERLLQVATTKAPHRLTGLAANRAVPARIGGRASLIWRHSLDDVPVVEIQTALWDCEEIVQSLRLMSAG